MITSPDKTILIYTGHSCPRLQYIADVLFAGKAGLTNSAEDFISFTGFKINYTAERMGAVNTISQQSSDTITADTLPDTLPETAAAEHLWIVPHGLLEQSGIQPQATDCFKWEGLTVFFKTAGDIPFDFLAASFYLISRYEEYLPHHKDAFGRYAHTNSLAYKEQFLNQPLIQCWLEKITPANQWRQPFSFLPTYDIDIAYSYLHHSTIRNVAGFFRDFLRMDAQAVGERLQVLNGIRPDPYAVYEWLDLLHDSLQLKPIYFFLVAQHKKGLDKNLSPNLPAVKKLIAHCAALYQLAVHPSVRSVAHPEILKKEIGLLQMNSGQPITASRNHYIMLQFPQTYRSLIAAGMEQDYSMGYPSSNGFRASYTAPFLWFDLLADTVTGLTIHPFCYMDSTAIFQERLAPEIAAEDLQYYFDTVKWSGGECITIFHNNFLTQQEGFIAWRDLYADFLLRNFTR